MCAYISASSRYRLCLTFMYRGCVCLFSAASSLHSGSQLLRLEILVTTQPTQPEKNDTQVTVVEDSSAPNSPANADATETSASSGTSHTPISLFVPEEPATSFTELIEEFRQREARMSSQSIDQTDVRVADAQETDAQGTGVRETTTEKADVEKKDVEGVKPDSTQSATKPHRLVPP